MPHYTLSLTVLLYRTEKGLFLQFLQFKPASLLATGVVVTVKMLMQVDVNEESLVLTLFSRYSKTVRFPRTVSTLALSGILNLCGKEKTETERACVHKLGKKCKRG